MLATRHRSGQGSGRAAGLGAGAAEALQLRLHLLRARLHALRCRLAEQVEMLPFGNEDWEETERELHAVESALESYGDWQLI